MSSPMDFLTECYYKESIETIKQVFSTLNKETINMDELLEGFKNMYRPSNMTTSTKENKVNNNKKKITRVQKELTDEEKCVATKKDGSRCKGKKLPSGSNPELCSLHNNSLAKSKITIKPKEIPEEVTCDHIFTKGINKGKQCIKTPLKNDSKCRLHSDLELEVGSNSSSSSNKSAITKAKQTDTKKNNQKTVVKKQESSAEYIEFEEDLGLDLSEDEHIEDVYADEENFE